MDQRVEAILEEANKLIFVKQYAEAERQLDELLETPEGRDTLIAHLRRVELAAMLKKLDKLRSHYLRLISKGEHLATYETCLAMVEQHGEFVQPSESINT